MTNEWILIGDVNPIEHGGTWIRKEEENIFEFVRLQEGHDDHVSISHGVVDIEDSWIDAGDVENLTGVSKETPEMFAVAIIDYYGFYEFDQNPDYESSPSKIKAYLKGQGISI